MEIKYNYFKIAQIEASLALILTNIWYFQRFHINIFYTILGCKIAQYYSSANKEV